MADKYCDHGAYGAAVFSGYISNTASNDNGVAGTTLTVTAVASGVVNIGTEISGGGALSGTTVTAFVSGTQGGVGVYTVASYVAGLQQNQAVRATSGLVGRFAQPLNTPLTWGAPQEGDGTAATPAASSATISADLSGATAAAGAVLSIMGASLTCVASGASANQFNAGSGTTLIDNIVTAINRSTNTVTIAAQASGWRTPLLQNAVFARRNGNFLEIMTRAGSAVYNASLVTTSGFTGGTFGPYTFSGGSGGCWGWITNMLAAMWPSSIAATTYGLWGTTGPLAGSVVDGAGLGDTVYLRAARNVSHRGNTANLAVTLGGLLGGTPSRPVSYLVDDGTVWPADAPNPVLTISHEGNQSSSVFSVASSASQDNINVIGKRYSSGQRSLVFSMNHGGGGALAFSRVNVLNVDFDYTAIGSGGTTASFTIRPGDAGNGVNRSARVFGCRFRQPLSTAWFSSNSNSGSALFESCVFDAAGLSIPNTGIFNTTSLAGSGPDFVFEGCSFVGFPAQSRLFAVGTNPNPNLSLSFSNTAWGNVTQRGPLTPSGTIARRLSRVYSGSNQFGLREFFIDQSQGYVDWTASLGFPTCNAVLLDGTTPWSMRAIPTTDSASISAGNPFELPRVGKINTLSEAALTVTVNMAVEASLPATSADISILVTYLGSDGLPVVVDSYNPAAVDLPASSATWSQEVGGQVAFYPGPILHDKHTITVTTPTPVPLDAEVSVHVRFHRSVPDTGKTIFVDPEIILAVA